MQIIKQRDVSEDSLLDYILLYIVYVILYIVHKSTE